jgi:hypothetical protein
VRRVTQNRFGADHEPDPAKRVCRCCERRSVSASFPATTGNNTDQSGADYRLFWVAFQPLVARPLRRGNSSAIFRCGRCGDAHPVVFAGIVLLKNKNLGDGYA